MNCWLGGYARDVVTYVRETRLTNILSNIAIGKNNFKFFFLGNVLAVRIADPYFIECRIVCQ